MDSRPVLKRRDLRVDQQILSIINLVIFLSYGLLKCSNIFPTLKASKELPDEDQKPVAKPKEKSPKAEKKKEKKQKKKKKKKKGKGGELGKIDEDVGESDVITDPPSSSFVDESSESKIESSTKEEYGADQVDEENNVTLEKLSTLVGNGDVIASGGEEDAQEIHVEFTDDELADSEGSQSEDEKQPSDRLNTQLEKSRESVLDSLDGFTRNDSTGSQLSGFSVMQTGPVYENVTQVVPEELNIQYADDIFRNCAARYQIFVVKTHDFKSTVDAFTNMVPLLKENAELKDYFEAYGKLLEQESEKDNQVEMSDVNVSLQTLRANGNQLLDIIDNVRPHVDRLIDDASNVDVIEYVKGKMVEGVQLGITSKFSAPGKYRRNMKHLRKALSNIDAVQEEVKAILEDDVFLDRNECSDSDEENGPTTPPQPPSDNESDIVPMVQQEDVPTNDIFHKLDNMSVEESLELSGETKPVDGSQSPSYERKLMTSDNKKANMTLLEQSIEAERQTSPEPQTMTFVIENIPENGKSPVNTSTPTDKNAIQQIIVEEEEHNTLDFGKYILVDPNTGDIAVMRNRSRSLDSLVSIQSNRSSISKFGSFEFVTDYELTIAEKNQQLKS
ncbi:uncharacterized protein [Clytia hemisphaerica]|uniref:Uncharacterized protein n=1 Tax=Clytia hemisphaerica TaxID=252671 RepID=A0A7M5XAW6_9CNID